LNLESPARTRLSAKHLVSMSNSNGAPEQPNEFVMYRADLSHVPSAISELLSTYSHISVDQQKGHVKFIRDRAYKSYPYPCLGRWRFLELDLASHPLYQTDILPKLSKEGADWIYLDLGCCLGQDIRKLLHDGADPARVYGAELLPAFVDAGYELFGDEDKFPRKEHFITPANVFDFSDESDLSRKCDGKVGILHSTAVFHLFNWDQQCIMARRCLQLMKKDAGKVSICGAQVGNVKPGEYPRSSGKGMRFRHDEKTWKQLWDTVVQTEPWKGKVRSIDVHSIMKARNFEVESLGLQQTAQGNNTWVNADSPTYSGRQEEDYRWQIWWVFVEFQ
jgi:SAM-dependent methyltransferase